MLRRSLRRAMVPGSFNTCAARGGGYPGVHMRIIAVAAIAAAVGIISPANAQNYFSSSTVVQNARDVYAACARMSTGGGIDVRASCACITGYMGGAMNDRDFEVAAVLLKIGEMTETGAPQASIDAVIIDFLQRGFTEADVTRVAAMVEQMGARGDAVCGQFEQKGSV